MKKKRIAILADGSLEGVISLTPAIAALKSKHPDGEFVLVAADVLRESTYLIPNLDFFTSSLESAEASLIYDFSDRRLPKSEESLGWRAYLESVGIVTEGNPYHHIDLARKVMGLDTVDVNFELLAPAADESALPPSLQSGSEGLRIAVCVATLEEPELSAILLGLGAVSIPHEIYLVGSVKEKKKSSEILAHFDGRMPIHDLCGHLGLNATAEVLRSADICIAGPGSSSLISSGYGTFTVCIDHNPARGPLHYPYGHGHLVLQRSQPDDYLTSLTGMAKEIVDYAVTANTGSVPTLEQWQAFADSRLDQYLGKIRLFATQRIETVLGDAQSLTELHLRPLLFLGAEPFDVMQTFYRLLWEHSINARTLISHDLDILHMNTIAGLSELLKPLEQLYQLANFGRNYCQLVKDALLASDMERSKQESDKVQEVEELIFTLGKSFPALSPLCAVHQRSQVYIPDLDAPNMADEVSDVFADLQSRVLVVLDLAKSLFHTTFLKESSGSSLEEANTNG
jgi:hypothetical protein